MADPSLASDERLAAGAAAGSRDDFAELVARYGAAVLAVLRRAVGDDHLAHDLLQEVWIKLFRALPAYRPSGSFRSWLFSIALNHVRDARRREQRSKVVFLDDYRGGREGTVDPRGELEERAEVEAALAAVDEPFRTALVLVDVHGLSYDEAAASLGCAVGTVKSRVARGRCAFRDRYLRMERKAAAPRTSP